MQSQNFEFLRHTWPELASLAGFAELYADADPQSALTKLRNFAERSVDIAYAELSLPRLHNGSFIDLLHDPGFQSATPRVILDKLHALRIHGNKAAHGDAVTPKTANGILKEAFDLGCWLFATYANGDVAAIAPYKKREMPRSAKADYKAERRQLLEKYARQEARMQSLLEELEREKEHRQQAERTAEELKSLQAEASAKGQRAVNALQFNEETTRKFLIDTQLAQVGWDVDKAESVGLEVEVKSQPTKTTKGYADYVLWDDNGKPLAVVEAKKTAVEAEAGRHQARIYADGLESEYGQRPVIFYTNGHEIWIWDDHAAMGYPPRKLYGFYSKSSLQFLVRQRSERAPLSQTQPKEDLLGERLYQQEALKRICERYESKQRKALAVQATGTGKTRLAIALSDVFLKAGWGKRVLFLCDRRELRKQAKNAYSEFLTAPITILSKSSVEDTANRIFVATYPAMMKIFERFDPGFFDLIIADESHRSIYNIYGDIFRYFDGFQLGLTATPVEMVSRSTCKLFGCDFKHPTSNYPLDEAIQDHYLVPYVVEKVTTKFLREGIKAEKLTPEQIAQLEDEGQDPNLLDFESAEIDQAIFNKDTNRKVIQNLMEHGLRQGDDQTLGKTIVFARNHQHAILLERLFNEMYPQYGGKFCQVIDNYNPRAEELIDDFKGKGSNNELTIAISVDMLDTGIDVPEILNLVFARPVKSPVKFWQMVGRGTRLCKDLFGPGKHKTHFQIFDHWGVVEYHGMKQRDVTISHSKPLMQRVFETRLQLAEVAESKGEVDFLFSVMRWLHQAINALNDKTIGVRDKWKVKQQMSNLDTLCAFSPATKTALRMEIAPLMLWRDIRGHGEAYRWDLLISSIQIERLRESAGFDDKAGEAIGLLQSLRMNLNQVKDHATMIKQCWDINWWHDATLEDIEQAREALRSIIQYREKAATEAVQAPVVDIEDSGELREAQKTHLNANDMAAYRVKVEKALQELFDKDPALQKIRSGESVTEKELNALNSLVHTQHPDVDFATLKAFYGSAAPLDQILRTIVGMNSEAVNARFAEFVRKHPNLNSRQIKFLTMLKRQIAQSGAIEIDNLYEMPFAAIGEPDDLFGEEEQIGALLKIVESFGVVPPAPN
ncbi:DEAD/DEAH box helicase family protein [Alcanivorax sp. 1008]|nr:DEAD/DEAH box helicase family protein [Alcanivorax sp. 1008]